MGAGAMAATLGRPIRGRGMSGAARRAAGAFAALAALAAGGCSNTFLPVSIPDRTTVLERATYRLVTDPAGSATGEAARALGGGVGYALVPLTPQVIALLEAEEALPAFSGLSTDARPTDVLIGVGDLVTVTIFESSAGGLFIPGTSGAGGNFVQLPNQQVGRDGTIRVPFGGAIPAAGRTPAQVGRAIESRLGNRALEPQVVVTIAERIANAVTVVGEVNTSARFPLDPAGERLLSAVARAGGPKFPAYETMVSLQRDGRVDRALLAQVARDPRQNVALRPGDVVFLSREPRHFVSLGAMGQNTSASQINRRFPFDDIRITLTDAMGRAGGLADDRVNGRAVFLYRQETRRTLERAGLAVAPGAGDSVPTVYVADMLDPGTFFLANRLPLRNGDLLYASNAPATELSKFLSLVLPGSTSIGSVRGVFR